VIPGVIARRPLPLLGAAAAVAAAAAAGIVIGLAARGSTTSAPGPALRAPVKFAAGTRPAPGFTLRNLAPTGGGSVSLGGLKGHVVLVTFLDSHCRNLCPIVGHELAAAERRLPAGVRPVVVAVSVNPADTPASVATAARLYGWSAGYRWAGGTHAGLAPVWRRYGIQVKPTTNDIMHGEAVYLIDRAGYERAAYLPPFRPADIAADVRTLSLEGGGG
jgi:cytochrome oxidase Cu insertion factor (SCO1/SenC/PrrC family)